MLWSNWPLPIPRDSLPPTSRKIYFMISTEVCFIQMWISPWHTQRFMVSSLMDSCFTSMPPCPAPALASNIYNLFISNPSLQVLFSFNHLPLSLMSQLTRHAHYISLPYMVFKCHRNIRNQLVPTTIPSPSSFHNITVIRKYQHLGKILKYIFSYVFQDSIAYS